MKTGVIIAIAGAVGLLAIASALICFLWQSRGVGKEIDKDREWDTEK